MAAFFSRPFLVRFVIFAVLLWCLTGCIDTVPFTGIDDKNRQLFVECELKNFDKTEAYISHPVNLGEKGIQFDPVKADDVVLTIAEMNKDIVYPFVFDSHSKRFSVEHDSFRVSAGRNYILKAFVKGQTEELYAMIEMPGKFLYDSITCQGVTVESGTGGTVVTKSAIRFYYDAYRFSADQFVHFILSDSHTGQVIPFSVSGRSKDFVMLNHRPGMLWYMDRLDRKDFVEFSFLVTGEKKLDSIQLSIKNTTKSYYDYQKFISSSPNTPTPSTNPVIAGFNIFSDAGYGSFSASYEEKVPVLLK